jgi:hypothetical protein
MNNLRRAALSNNLSFITNNSRDQARLKSKIKARLRTIGVIRTDTRLFSASGQSALLDQFNDAFQKTIFAQLFAVLNQMLASLEEAKRPLIEFSRRFPEVHMKAHHLTEL